MPLSHTTNVSKDRASLVYAIVMGMTVDLGKVIQGSIICVSQGSTIGGLSQPHLITDLCHHAGVMWRPEEKVLKAQDSVIVYHEEPALRPVDDVESDEFEKKQYDY